MAHRKAASASIVAQQTSDHDPLSWLYLNPPEEGFEAEPGYSFGVLRQAYRGRTNTAEEFCRRKAQPVEPSGDPLAIPWNVTAVKIEVLLPRDADDRYRDPWVLTGEVDARAVDNEQALLTYITIPFPDARRLHEPWETARAFAREQFVLKRGLPVVLIQHAPHLSGSNNAVHCHLLIVPRTLDGLGLRGFEADLCCDRGQQIVHAEWLSHKVGRQAISHG